MEWTNKRTLELLHNYERHAVLWNPQHPNHKTKHVIYNAWLRIRANLSFKVTIEELKVKIKSLTSYYKRHLNKYKTSLKSEADTDEVYQTSWFAFSKMNSFLLPIYQCQSNKSNPQASETKNPQKIIDNEGTSIEKITKQNVEIQEDKKINNPPSDIVEEDRPHMLEAVYDSKTNKMDQLELFTKFLETKIRSIRDPTAQSILMNDLSTLCFRAEMADRTLQSNLPFPNPCTSQSLLQQTFISCPCHSASQSVQHQTGEQVLKPDESFNQTTQHTSHMPPKKMSRIFVTDTGEIKLISEN